MRGDEPGALAAEFWRLYLRGGRSIWGALHRLLWRPLYASAALLLVSTCAGFGVPLFLNAIISAVSSTVR